MSEQEEFDENAELIHSFTAESIEMLDDVEPRLIELQESTEESGHIDNEMLNSIFRLFHTMKGSAGFLELNNLQNVTHEAETLLDLYRKGELEPDQEHIDLLFKACDFIRMLLGHIEQNLHDHGFEDEAEQLEKDLANANSTEQKDTAKSTQPSQPVEPPPVVTQDDKEEPDKPQEEKGESGNGQDDAAQSDDSLISKEMVGQFISEAREIIDSLEQDLLKLEKEPENTELLNTSFRNIHTFKGNCGFLGLVDPEKLSHKTETLLEHMRTGEQKNIKQNISLILSIVDVLRDSVENLAQDKPAEIPACDVMLELLNDVIKEYVPESGAKPPEAAQPILEKKPLETPKKEESHEEKLPDEKSSVPEPSKQETAAAALPPEKQKETPITQRDSGSKMNLKISSSLRFSPSPFSRPCFFAFARIASLSRPRPSSRIVIHISPPSWEASK